MTRATQSAVWILRGALVLGLGVGLTGCLDFSTAGKRFKCEGASCADGGGSAGGGPGDIVDGGSCACPLPPPSCRGFGRAEAIGVQRCLDDGGCAFAEVVTACSNALCANGICGGEVCTGVTCRPTPKPVCISGGVLRVFHPGGFCTAGSCDWRATDVVCVCDQGRCASAPCVGVSCETPPPAACVGSSVRTWQVPGACDAVTGRCSYGFSDTPCSTGRCTEGRCEDDLCAGVACMLPVAPYCLDANRAVTPAVAGTCGSLSGACAYSTSVQTCPSSSCQKGSCAPPPPSCGPFNCAGCCDASTCVTEWTEVNSRCGREGAACRACPAGTPTCTNGRCT